MCAIHLYSRAHDALHLKYFFQVASLKKHKELPIIGVGKHLCGGATDLMLRCLTQQANAENKTSSLIFLPTIFDQTIFH